MSVVPTRLAKTMVREGGGTVDEALVDREIRLTVAAQGEHGARITATCLGTAGRERVAWVVR
jgi:hypothetical protein